MSKVILILAPHPDDSCLSFAGLITRNIRKGNKVIDICFTMGGPCSNVPTEVRLKEHESAMRILGVTESKFIYSDKDGRLDTIPNCELTSVIDRLIDEYKPEEVYCASNSEHADHSALYNAFLGASRLRSGFMPKLFAVGTYLFSDQLYLNSEGGKIYQPLSEEDFNLKCEAFSQYKTQCKPLPSPLGINGIRVMSEYHGMMCGHKYAELYYQLRYIRCLE